MESTNPTLTSLPLDLQARILGHICDENLHQLRSSLRGSNCCLFYRYFGPQTTIDGAEHAHAPFSKPLLALALASPSLAAAINQIVDLSYFTDLNTEAQLPLWLQAFAPYVHAVSTGHIAEASCANLRNHANTLMVRTICRDTFQLFKTITINNVKLNVLDLVHVPFDKFQPMHDHIFTGLCAALESSHNTLQQLALPVYPQSDLCARALEMVALPHLVLLSVELKNEPDPKLLCRREAKRLRLPFLRMIHAVDGHADRALTLTTLKELRLINMYHVPCTELGRSGCSAAFFHAVTTLRAEVNPSSRSHPFDDVSFFLLFSKLKCLYWSRKPPGWHAPFGTLCRRLEEVHLCHRRWITGAQVGTKIHEPDVLSDTRRVFHSINQSYRKIVTLVTCSALEALDIYEVAVCCPKLECLSLVITADNVQQLRALVEKCNLLTCLEIIIAEDNFSPLGKDEWHTLGKAIPRSHANLCEVAIQMTRRIGTAIPLNIVTDCFVNVVKRIGSQGERLVFRAFPKTRNLIEVSNALCRVVDACMGSLSLTYLEVDIKPRKSRIAPEDVTTASDALTKLRNSKDELLQRCDDLGKIDFGMFQRFVKESYQI